MDSEKLAWIRSQFDGSESAAELASRLNTPIEIDNPDTRKDIPAPINLANIRAVVPDGEALVVMETRTYDRILEAVESGDRAAISRHIQALVAGGKLSLETLGKLAPILSATIPDPNYQTKITASPAAIAGYGIVYTSEVEESLL